jgi:hypothetical protein
MKSFVFSSCLWVCFVAMASAQQPTLAQSGQPTNTYVTESVILQEPAAQQPSPSDMPAVPQDSVMESQVVTPVPAGTSAASGDCGCHSATPHCGGDCCCPPRRFIFGRRFFGRCR